MYKNVKGFNVKCDCEPNNEKGWCWVYGVDSKGPYWKNARIDLCLKRYLDTMIQSRIWTTGSCCGHNGLHGTSPEVLIKREFIPIEHLRLRPHTETNKVHKVYIFEIEV